MTPLCALAVSYPAEGKFPTMLAMTSATLFMGYTPPTIGPIGRPTTTSLPCQQTKQRQADSLQSTPCGGG
jgi:hypothetical protein